MMHALSISEVRLPGQYYDQETGLHYNYFRYYDPSIGRYTKSDPIGLRGGFNTYLYVGANPYTYIDLYGLRVKATIPAPNTGGVNYTSGGLPDGSIGTVECDGNGNLKPVLDPNIDSCIVDCVRAHEEEHIRRARQLRPTVCQGIRKGRSIGFRDGNIAEIEAYRVELRCLSKKLKNECKNGKCDSKIRERINEIENEYLPEYLRK